MKLGLWFGLALWLAAVFALLKIADAAKLSPFDPTQSLIMQSMELSFEPRLSAALKPVETDLANKVIHIRSGDCVCESLAEKHSSELSNNLAKLGFKSEAINLDALPELAKLVPSTPAVMVFNHEQKLLYLGPYSEGLGCFTNSSLSQKIIKLSQSRYFGAQINADVEGCYCANKLAVTR
jgi:hypothetical protein